MHPDQVAQLALNYFFIVYFSWLPSSIVLRKDPRWSIAHIVKMPSEFAICFRPLILPMLNLFMFPLGYYGIKGRSNRGLALSPPVGYNYQASISYLERVK